jgi:hypothetical protein
VRFAPHTAFVDPTTPADAPPRESIEVRTLVFTSIKTSVNGRHSKRERRGTIVLAALRHEVCVRPQEVGQTIKLIAKLLERRILL